MILATLALAAMSSGSVAMPAPASVPSSCPATTVERWNDATPSQYPFARVRPTFTGITMQMQTATIGAPGTRYAPMRASGTTVVWGGASSTVTIAATELEGSGAFTIVQPVLQSGRVLSFPYGGCWKLHVTSGLRTGDLVLWVVQ
ncbi:MAG TPA: hypothetical protein VIG46_12250 [Candidatus Baltobacteraceae bacterium]|jgi:hypothetical protein